MPRYDYKCEDCSETFDLWASISRYAKYTKGHRPRCPGCGSDNTVRVFGPVNVQTRGRTMDASVGGGCCPGRRCS